MSTTTAAPQNGGANPPDGSEDEDEWPSWTAVLPKQGTDDALSAATAAAGSATTRAVVVGGSAMMDSDDEGAGDDEIDSQNDGGRSDRNSDRKRNRPLLLSPFGFGTAVANLRDTVNSRIARPTATTARSLPGPTAAVSQSARNLTERLSLTDRVAVISKQVEDFKKAAAAIDEKEAKKIDRAAGKTTDRANDELHRSPEAILRSSGCSAKLLSVSDQHATVLLVHSASGNGGGGDGEGDGTKTTRSLLKLAVVPFHKGFLGRQPTTTAGNDADDEAKKAEAEGESRKIISFLSNYRFDLTSESGAEYSYYDASPSHDGGSSMAGATTTKTTKTTSARRSGTSNNGEVGLVTALDMALRGLSDAIAGKADTSAPVPTTTAPSLPSAADGRDERANDGMALGRFTVELVSPASERQIQRAMPTPLTALVEETAEIYGAVTRPFIDDIVSGGSLGWITNIIEGRKEKERLLLDHEAYILNVDTKWRSHPDCNTVPRDSWYRHESTEDLYCLAILKQGAIASLRDLGEEHVPILRSIMADGTRTIERVYGVSPDQLRIFVHYQPQFYHFHVHFTRLNNEIGCQVERGHLVSDIIQNLELDPDFYAKRSITYRLRVTDKLYKRIEEYKKGLAKKETEEVAA